MNVDLSKNLNAVAPWNLSITWDQAEYVTRRPSVGLIGRIQTMKGMKLPEMVGLVKEIFTAPPELTEWPPEALFGALNAYMGYFNQESVKNSQAIAASVDAAMADQPK
jgi:hypothetical protein